MPTVEIRNEDIFSANTAAIVIPVNCNNIMGAGIALRSKSKCPGNYKVYKSSPIRIGKVLITEIPDNPFKYVINLPTKDHWRNPSKLEWIESGLVDLRYWIEELGIESIAIPELGCGCGGLKYKAVRPLIYESLDNLWCNSEIYVK